MLYLKTIILLFALLATMNWINSAIQFLVSKKSMTVYSALASVVFWTLFYLFSHL